MQDSLRYIITHNRFPCRFAVISLHSSRAVFTLRPETKRYTIYQYTLSILAMPSEKPECRAATTDGSVKFDTVMLSRYTAPYVQRIFRQLRRRLGAILSFWQSCVDFYLTWRPNALWHLPFWEIMDVVPHLSASLMFYTVTLRRLWQTLFAQCCSLGPIQSLVDYSFAVMQIYSFWFCVCGSRISHDARTVTSTFQSCPTFPLEVSICENLHPMSDQFSKNLAASNR